MPVDWGLNHKVVWWIIQDIKDLKCILTNSQTRRNSKDLRLRNAMDQRHRNSKVTWRPHHNTIVHGPKESGCRRATCSEKWPIFERKTDCFKCDPWPLSLNCILWGIQGLSDLFRIQSHNEEIQDFNRRCKQAIYQQVIHQQTKIWKVSKSQDVTLIQTILALHNTDMLKVCVCVKLHIDQTLRNKNFRVERSRRDKPGPRVFRDTRRKTGECFQWRSIIV